MLRIGESSTGRGTDDVIAGEGRSFDDVIATGTDDVIVVGGYTICAVIDGADEYEVGGGCDGDDVIFGNDDVYSLRPSNSAHISFSIIYKTSKEEEKKKRERER